MVLSPVQSVWQEVMSFSQTRLPFPANHSCRDLKAAIKKGSPEAPCVCVCLYIILCQGKSRAEIGDFMMCRKKKLICTHYMQAYFNKSLTVHFGSCDI